MSIVYLVTGATGFLGHFVVRKLLSQGKEVVGLRLAGDKQHLIEGASYEVGDVTRPFSLKKFFDHATGREAFVLHCAGPVSIESQNPRLWRVNVDGTRNILDWCVQSKIKRMVYVSSVHANHYGASTNAEQQRSCSKYTEYISYSMTHET